jgi:hypothetical protein
MFSVIGTVDGANVADEEIVSVDPVMLANPDPVRLNVAAPPLAVVFVDATLLRTGQKAPPVW